MDGANPMHTPKNSAVLKSLTLVSSGRLIMFFNVCFYCIQSTRFM